MGRVLVTGGAGFIGSNLTDRLLADGHEVTVVDDLSTGKLANLTRARRDPDLPLHFVRLDITSDALDSAVARARPEVVVHLAAQVDVRASVADPVADAMTNVVGTVNVLQACARHDVDKIVNVSSGGAIYGEPLPEALPVDERHPAAPRSPYAAGKLAAEGYLATFEALHGLRWTSLALANVYGPRQDPTGEAGVVALFAAAMLRGDGVTIYGDGEQTRDFVFVGDVVEALVAALEAGDGARLNIGTGAETSVNGMFALLAELTGHQGRPRYAPPRPGELGRIAVDASAAASSLGWKPKVSLREGVAETIEWLQA
jgi:UDP-glucose 4-epimerase